MMARPSQSLFQSTFNSPVNASINKFSYNVHLILIWIRCNPAVMQQCYCYMCLVLMPYLYYTWESSMAYTWPQLDQVACGPGKGSQLWQLLALHTPDTATFDTSIPNHPIIFLSIYILKFPFFLRHICVMIVVSCYYITWLSIMKVYPRVVLLMLSPLLLLKENESPFYHYISTFY